MVSTPGISENKKKLIKIYKPFIYILPKDSSDLNQIVSKTFKHLGKNYHNITKTNTNSEATNYQLFAAAIAVATTAFATGSLLPVVVITGSFASLGSIVITGASIYASINKHKEDSFNQEKNDTKSIVSQNEIEQTLEKIDFSNWIDFIEQIPFSSIPEELDFPPGHPLPNRFYRVHPLKNKNHQYIPAEQFESLLYKERESELIKLLVDLGATDICVQELSSSKTKESVEGKVSLIGLGEGSFEKNGESQKLSSNSQITKLKPKNWTPENFNPEIYSWLPYEPYWESLVYARLKGGCLSSSIELTSDTSFAISAQLGLAEGLFKNLGSLGFGGEFSRLRKEKKRFEVKFIDV
ncbi:MAG: hypothetical protein QNJ34_28480 [Xenococcaceae cyanobacterium MO_188.B29]|nr:hypothetical protein [Xenococcaceae cyanobacterium MO_188.B29]